MSKKFVTLWLFTAHKEGELDEYFSADHDEAVAETAREIVSGLIQERNGDEICYDYKYNHRKIRYTILRFADIIVRADVTIRHIKARLMNSEIEKRVLRSKLTEMERRLRHESDNI